MMKYSVSLFLCLILTGVFSQAGFAKQTSFSQARTENGRSFEYVWLDGSRKTKRLSFTIAHETLLSLPESAPAYNPILAQNAIRRALLLYAKTVDPRIAKINIKQSGGAIQMQVTAPTKEDAEEINRILGEQYSAAESAYMAKHYYVPFKNELGQDFIKQDHRRYALESAQGMHTIVEEIKKQLSNPRNSNEFIDFTLSWLQAIPYDTLENRASSNGSGFSSPRQLLLDNRGDCDSKSTLLLALMNAYNPKLQTSMIYLPNHALVGISLKPRDEQQVITDDGLPFVLAEPTGPAQYSLGEIDNKSELAIRNRQVSIERL
jgi:hypothetical protein